MARTINYTDRLVDSFTNLEKSSQADMLAELFTHLDAEQAGRALLLMRFWDDRRKSEAIRNGKPIPLLEAE